jgi:hypothetical protein
LGHLLERLQGFEECVLEPRERFTPESLLKQRFGRLLLAGGERSDDRGEGGVMASDGIGRSQV